MGNYKEENRKRLIDMLGEIKADKNGAAVCPFVW